MGKEMIVARRAKPPRAMAKPAAVLDIPEIFRFKMVIDKEKRLERMEETARSVLHRGFYRGDQVDPDGADMQNKGHREVDM